MPDVRKEVLPASDWSYNPFFEREVQSILEPRRKLRSSFDKCLRDFRLAWPLIVFEISSEIANEVSDIERHSGWLWCYKLDRQFSVDLLAAITRFVELPRDKWGLRRALVEFQNTASDQSWDSVSEEGQTTCSRVATNSPSVIAWKDVAAYIEMNCPHLRSVWLSGERLRKKEFYTEKKRREATLRLWQPNFAALERYGRNKWYERMPCLPG
jgi:hypothetical protein